MVLVTRFHEHTCVNCEHTFLNYSIEQVKSVEKIFKIENIETRLDMDNELHFHNRSSKNF